MLVSAEKKHTGIDALRWVGVIPAAYLAGWLGQSIGHGLFTAFRGPGYPRRRIEVAVILAAVSILPVVENARLGTTHPGPGELHARNWRLDRLAGRRRPDLSASRSVKT